MNIYLNTTDRFVAVYRTARQAISNRSGAYNYIQIARPIDSATLADVARGRSIVYRTIQEEELSRLRCTTGPDELPDVAPLPSIMVRAAIHTTYNTVDQVFPLDNTDTISGVNQRMETLDALDILQGITGYGAGAAIRRTLISMLQEAGVFTRDPRISARTSVSGRIDYFSLANSGGMRASDVLTTLYPALGFNEHVGWVINQMRG